MTEDGEIVHWNPITSEKSEFLETLAQRYGYKGRTRAIIRPAQAGLLADVIYHPETKTYDHVGFNDQGIQCILPSGHLKYRLPIGTTGVLPQTLPGSPVSGLAYVIGVHVGGRPWVKLNVACSGMNTLLQLAMEADRPVDSGLAGAPSRSAPPTPPVGPKPQACPHCHKRTICWDAELRCWWCSSCAWSDTTA